MKFIALALSIASLSVFASSNARAACGQLEVSKGDIKIESGGRISAAAVGAKICAGDTIVAGKDSRAKIKMEDGNELNVSPDSKIALETYQFVPAQNKKKVLLNILQGKVRAATKQENMYNDKSADGSDNTFQVKTKSAVAGVRGTDFLTGFDPKSNKSEVVTFRGKVEFGQPGPNGSIANSVQVGAGQKTDMAPGQPPAVPRAVPPKEMQQLNSDTKSDSGSSSSNSNSGGDKKSSDKSDKKDGGGDKQASGNNGGGGDKQGSGDKQSGGGDKQGGPAPTRAVASNDGGGGDPKPASGPGNPDPKPAPAPGPGPGPSGPPLSLPPPPLPDPGPPPLTLPPPGPPPLPPMPQPPQCYTCMLPTGPTHLTININVK